MQRGHPAGQVHPAAREDQEWRDVYQAGGAVVHLDQHKTKCSDQGCGPTAVVNSFVYLQTYYTPLSNLQPRLLRLSWRASF